MTEQMVKPYDTGASKKEEVAAMFDSIAPKYDFLNHFFSLGIDVLWRKRCIRILKMENPRILLDMATGTADFAIEAARMGLKAEKIIGMDISPGMLSVGREKVKKKGFPEMIELVQGDSEHLPFETASFDAFTVGFGVRNFEHLETGLMELLRVLRPGGLGVILEFSKPKRFPMKQLFRFYFRFIMPVIGRMVSKDKRAYTYLPESVDQFPSGSDFLAVLEKLGYREVKCIPLTGGIASIYLGRK